MAFGRRQYPFHLIEPKWQNRWDEQQTFRAWNPGEMLPADHPFGQRHASARLEDLPKYYILDMFPYPSGAGLHVGHPEGYTATDILARYRRARGYNVLHPIGWDAFGLPAEQYAIKTGQHPRKTTEANVATFKRQIKSLGFSYDWSRELDTTDPRYFKWTQWIFLKLYHSWFNPQTNKAEPIESLPYPPDQSRAGVPPAPSAPIPPTPSVPAPPTPSTPVPPAALEQKRRAYRDSKRLAYVTEAPVWWCEQLGTVLANEEVVDGKSEVGDFPVVRKPMRQWMLRITAYAERLLDDLETIEWSDSLKEMQRNWIGRSEGAEVDFQLSSSPGKIRVFTTRPDTLFGATYMVLAPEHRLVDLIATPEQRAALAGYKNEVSKKSDLERTELAKEKTGVFTGAHAINPVNGQSIPIWIADYVLVSYGTGAIMAVPGHDTRDFEFATKFNLPIVQVVQPPEGKDWQGYVQDGISVNSSGADITISGLATPEAKQKITAWLESQGLGKRTINYKLRDWLFSRQRYWGEPFPIIWKTGSDGQPYHEALPESALPLLPPPLEDYKPTPDGQPPLARAKDWLNLPDGSKRETNTMPQWAGSCWYYLRYLDPQNPDALASREALDYWKGPDIYVGGAEHAVLHLLYARFWHKVLFDLGHVRTPEPFQKLVNQGLILGEDGQKMSKSRGNVVNPDDVVSEYGADALRLYEMFMGPLEQVKPWQMKGVEGVSRFLARVWRVAFDENEGGITVSSKIQDVTCTDKELLRVVHETIKKVGEDIEKLSFNTAISQMMICTNAFTQAEVVPKKEFTQFLTVLNPFAPHLAEEINSRLGGTTMLSETTWPTYDEAALVRNEIELVVQVNGKLRDRLMVSKDIDEEGAKAAAFASSKVNEHLEGKTIRKIVFIPGKIFNIVAN